MDNPPCYHYHALSHSRGSRENISPSSTKKSERQLGGDVASFPTEEKKKKSGEKPRKISNRRHSETVQATLFTRTSRADGAPVHPTYSKQARKRASEPGRIVVKSSTLRARTYYQAQWSVHTTPTCYVLWSEVLQSKKWPSHNDSQAHPLPPQVNPMPTYVLASYRMISYDTRRWHGPARP